MRDYKIDNSDWHPSRGRRKGGGAVWKTLIIVVVLGGAGYAGFSWYQTHPHTETAAEANSDPRIVTLEIPPLKGSASTATAPSSR